MTRLPRFWRAFAVGLAAAATTVSVTQVANAGPNPPPAPAPPSPPAGNQVFLVGHTGPGSVQIYTCSPSTTTPGSFTWTATPDATLLGDNGQQIATHFAGPTWQATDGSKFVGKLPPLRTAPSPNPDSIPMLLLAGTATPVGADGGRLGATTFVQRADTKDGLAPAASACAQATDVGKQERKPYSAVYYFWKATGKPPKPTA